jgi:hypothetical protein
MEALKNKGRSMGKKDKSKVWHWGMGTSKTYWAFRLASCLGKEKVACKSD